MRIAFIRANTVRVVASSQELSALVSGARMAAAVVGADPNAPDEARELAALIRRALASYDRALSHASSGAAQP